MSELAKKLTGNARKKGALNEKSNKYFSVTEKKLADVGGEMVEVRVPNGKHCVKIISEKIGPGKAFNGKEGEQLQMIVSDNGEQKEWNVSIKNQETGKLNYIVESLENYRDRRGIHRRSVQDEERKIRYQDFKGRQQAGRSSRNQPR